MLLTHLILPLVLVQTPAQLEIKDAKVGTGPEVQVGDLVTVEYTGTLTTGKQFDSSKGKPPFQFQVGVGQVIKGWDQGILGMKIGGVRNLTIPASLAYGDKEVGDIPANSTLKFEVTLIKIADRVKVKELTKGTGAPAQIGDKMLVHYKGTLKDGTEFDSSYKRTAPMLFILGQRVIPGFTQGLMGMKQGEKRQIIIPAELAYGARQIPPNDVTDPSGKVIKAGSIIPMNAELTFEVELVKLNPSEEKK